MQIMKDKQCWHCVYGENRTGEIQCENGIVKRLRRKESKPDPYDCEFYEPVSDDYVADVDKVLRSNFI